MGDRKELKGLFVYLLSNTISADGVATVISATPTFALVELKATFAEVLISVLMVSFSAIVGGYVSVR